MEIHSLRSSAAADALRHRDAGWLGLQRRESLEAIVSAGVGLVGLLGLGWPALGMMIFLMFSLWLGLLTDLMRVLLQPDALRESLARQAADERVWASVRAMRCSLPEPRATKPLPGGPGLQLGIAFWLAAWMTGALAYEVHRVAGIDLLAETLSRPGMLITMTFMCLAQVEQAVALLMHQKGQGVALISYTPVLDVVMFVVLMFFWMVISGIVTELGSVTGDADASGLTVTVFVAAGFGLMLWRGIVELRELRLAKADREWLRRVLDGEGRP